MNAKTISIVAILVVVALGVFFAVRAKTNPPAATPTVTTEEETILTNQVNSLTQDQLAAISTDLTNFSTATQNDIASDSSMFMYQ